MRNVWTVAAREFRSYFDQATAYVLLVVFLVVNFFFYFRTIFVTAEATLRPMFDLLPWLLLFFVPAVTMRALAEERSRGTLELVLSQPLRELEFLLGKFLGVLGFLAVALAGTLGAVVALQLGSDPFGGVIFAQYVGALLLAGAFTAVSLWASSLTRNQITAFIVGVATTFVLVGITLNVVLIGLPPALAAAATRLGVLTHFENVARGVIDLRDVVYFVTVVVAFLALAYLEIQRGRLTRKGGAWRTLQAGTAGILGICIAVNLLGSHIRGRLDLTPGRAYTLSPATREVLDDLDDLVTIQLFASRELPPQVEVIRRDVEDLLADYRAAAGGDLRVETRIPEGENEAREEAERLGIPAIQFNVLGEEEFQVRQGYLGVAVRYADELETIPFVRQAADLEYRLTSTIRSLIRPERPAVGFLTGHGEADIVGDLQGAAETLRESYSVTAVNVTADTAEIADSLDVLVIAGAATPISEGEGEKLRAFLERGGNLLLLLQRMGIEPQLPFASPQPNPVLDSLLADYGARVPGGMVMDLRSNGRVNVPSASGFSLVVPYPLWIEALPASGHPIVEGLSAVLMPWASPLDLSAADTSRATVLLATSEAGAHLTGRHPINPQSDWRALAADLARRPVAAALLPRGSVPEDAPEGGRMIVVGDAEFALNRFLNANPENLLFLLNAVDWLAEDESLISIRARSRRPPPLLFESDGLRDAVKYGNLIGVPLLFVLVGAWRLWRRRKLAGLAYVPGAGAAAGGGEG